MINKIVLVGGFVEIIELCLNDNIEIFGIIDKCRNFKINYKYLGNDEDAEIFTYSRQDNSSDYTRFAL